VAWVPGQARDRLEHEQIVTDNNLGASAQYGGLARARIGIRTSAGMGEGEESNIFTMYYLHMAY
jgi:hypothetical protein